MRKVKKILKYFIEYLITLLIFPLFLLIHLIIFVLIKIDSKGPVFFKQKRAGKNEKTFYIFKYRTMYVNGDELLKEYLKNHPEEIEYYNHFHKYKNDPRVTKIGKILRVTSLDELPQIINVLKGEMSLIGPRPYMIDELKKLGKYKNAILSTKPGITGLWQVSGRNNLTFRQRVELEFFYSKKWSLCLDIYILLKTIKVVLFRVGVK